MSLWVYNLGGAQLDGSSALSQAHSRVGDGWLLTDLGFPWGDSALPHLPLTFQQTNLGVPGKDRDAGDSKLKQAKPTSSFADLVSASILLAKASHVADPRVKECFQFPTVRKYHTAKSHGEGGKTWVIIAIYHTCHSTLRSGQVLPDFIRKTWYDQEQKLFIFRTKRSDQKTY